MEDEWETLLGGYKVPYDPRDAILRLESVPMDESAWGELFENLHHQGDLGEASYASIPMLVDVFQDKPRNWRFYCLISLVESERCRGTNPSVPVWLYDTYTNAIKIAKELALIDLETSTDRELIQCAMAVVAFAADSWPLGALLLNADKDETELMLKKYY